MAPRRVEASSAAAAVEGARSQHRCHVPPRPAPGGRRPCGAAPLVAAQSGAAPAHCGADATAKRVAAHCGSFEISTGCCSLLWPGPRQCRLPLQPPETRRWTPRTCENRLGSCSPVRPGIGVADAWVDAFVPVSLGKMKRVRGVCALLVRPSLCVSSCQSFRVAASRCGAEKDAWFVCGYDLFTRRCSGMQRTR